MTTGIVRRWPGWVFVEHTTENAVAAFSATLLGAMGAAAVHTSEPELARCASQAGFAALSIVLYSLTSLRVGNGTASFIPRVVAARRRLPRTGT